MKTIETKRDEFLQLIRLADAQQRFIRRWQPEDPPDQYEFARDLQYLIHITYREAQTPLMKQLTKLAMLHPSMPTIVEP